MKYFAAKGFSVVLALTAAISFLAAVQPCLAQTTIEPTTTTIETTTEIAEFIELKAKVFVDKSADLTLADHVVSSARGGPDSAFILGYSQSAGVSNGDGDAFIIKFNTLTLELVWKKSLGNIGTPRAMCLWHNEMTRKTSAYIGMFGDFLLLKLFTA